MIDNKEECPTCKGTGLINAKIAVWPDYIVYKTEERMCPECQGRGWVIRLITK